MAGQHPRAAERRRAGDAAGGRRQLTPDDFPVAMTAAAPLNEDVPLPPGGVDLEQLERSLVVQALERSDWNQTQAARLLGLNRDQIRYRIEKFRLDRATTNTGKP